MKAEVTDRESRLLRSGVAEARIHGHPQLHHILPSLYQGCTKQSSHQWCMEVWLMLIRGWLIVCEESHGKY
jgi:hypothetical protein